MRSQRFCNLSGSVPGPLHYRPGPSFAGELAVVTQEKYVNYCKFEFGAFMLPVSDRKVISQEGHFSISGYAGGPMLALLWHSPKVLVRVHKKNPQ